MSVQKIDSMHAVFGKTPSGRDELRLRGNGLTSRQRSILILMDGVRSLEMLTVLTPRQELQEALPYLQQQGYVAHLVAAAAQPPLAVPAAAIASMPPAAQATARRLTQDAGQVRQVQDFMVTTTQTYLGLTGADVIQRIERAKDAGELMAVVGHWHMALHGSRHGSRFAAPYLEQVKAGLAELQ